MSLLKFLKENADARKIFGQRELKIIEKQILGVNLTQSEKNRLSRDIRKKLEFIGKISRYDEEFELKKGAEIKAIIQEAKEAILADILFKRITKIILYGSAVENRLTLTSDLDLAVQFDKISLEEATVFRKRICGKVDKKIDVQIYNYLPNKIKEEVDRGKNLYKNENK